jgi:hypothetical protein
MHKRCGGKAPCVLDLGVRFTKLIDTFQPLHPGKRSVGSNGLEAKWVLHQWKMKKNTYTARNSTA